MIIMYVQRETNEFHETQLEIIKKINDSYYICKLDNKEVIQYVPNIA